MPQHTEMVHMLLEDTQRGHVYGPQVAFGPMTPERAWGIEMDSLILYDNVHDPIVDVVAQSFPDLTPEKCLREVDHALTKTVVFGPALAAGELGRSEGMRYLGQTAVGIMCMYIADQRVDVDDDKMLEAIERASGQWYHSGRPRNPVRARRHLFDVMDASINQISDVDAAEIKQCFLNYVLSNEARFFRHSQEYLRRGEQGKDSRENYMVEHGKSIANLMVADAGFQGVAGILHATYRKDPRYADLPLVSDIHRDPQMRRNIRTWNAVARVADERGDWWEDAGNDPEKGVFSINPFNVPHPALVGRLCELAGIDEPRQVALLQDRFEHFHDGNDGREATGQFITESFFDRMRDIKRTMDPDFRAKYDRYVTLAERVGEIAYVNMLGDIKMSAARGHEEQ